jgi:hypothetical protein
MRDSFFEPGKRSRCLFTPTLWCEPFKHEEPLGWFDFFCDIIPYTVGVVVPFASGADSQRWDAVYQAVE